MRLAAVQKCIFEQPFRNISFSKFYLLTVDQAVAIVWGAHHHLSLTCSIIFLLHRKVINKIAQSVKTFVTGVFNHAATSAAFLATQNGMPNKLKALTIINLLVHFPARALFSLTHRQCLWQSICNWLIAPIGAKQRCSVCTVCLCDKECTQRSVAVDLANINDWQRQWRRCMRKWTELQWLFSLCACSACLPLQSDHWPRNRHGNSHHSYHKHRPLVTGPMSRNYSLNSSSFLPFLILSVPYPSIVCNLHRSAATPPIGTRAA